jgi:3-methyladenine DNA glycosylase AlkC
MSALNHKREILSEIEYEYYNNCFTKFNFSNYNFIYLNLLVKKILASMNNTENPSKDHQILNLAGCKIDDDDKNDYESFIDNCLHHNFNDVSKINMVKKRLVMNFFTFQDMKMIFNLQ